MPNSLIPGRDKRGFLELPDLHARIEWADAYCYALTDGAAIKIGKSRGAPERRMAALSTGNPRPLYLLAWTVGFTEQFMHRRLSRYKLRAEWYRICPEVLDFVSTYWEYVDMVLLKRLRSAKCNS